MQLDDVTISRVIIKNFTEEFQMALDIDVAIGGAGPAGSTRPSSLAKKGGKKIFFLGSVRPGGGSSGLLGGAQARLSSNTYIRCCLFRL